jgi:CheY-like chemotaxis protein
VADFVKTIADFPPDIILTDVEMPEAAGDELCRILRGNIATANTPILLFSSLDPAILAERAAAAGADGFVCKTDGPAALQATLEKLLPRK